MSMSLAGGGDVTTEQLEEQFGSVEEAQIVGGSSVRRNRELDGSNPMEPGSCKGVIQVLHACFVHPRAILNLPICAGSSSSIVVCSSLIPTIDLAICFQYCLIGFCSHSHD